MRLVPLPEPPAPVEEEASGDGARAGGAADAGATAAEVDALDTAAADQAKPAAEPTEAPAAYDVALVVVHGMGEAYKSQILLEWAEPLLARMDWITRDRVYGADDSYGVELESSDLAGDEPIVGATVKYPKQRPIAADGTPIGPVESVTKRVAIVEARWAVSFVPLSNSQIFRWAAPFMWRAVTRMLRLFWATMVLLPWYTLLEHPHMPSTRLALKSHALTAVFDAIRLILGFAVYVPVAAGTVLLAVVLTPILPLVVPLLLIPAIKKAAGDIIQGVANSIGDVTAWKETPVRASAMRLVVRNAIIRAKALVGDGDVHVFAHSQGAAVSTYTLFEEMDPTSYNVRQLTTVGAAVNLLGREKWHGRLDSYTPVKNWVGRRTGDRPVEWANHWAIWDPFSAGPIGDTPGDARQRWRAAYFPRPQDKACGPEEHAVHNVSQPIFDHTYYFTNTLQVVEPTVRNLLGPDLAGPPRELAYIENRLNVINKKSLGTNMIAAVIIAALLPGLPAASEFFASVVTTVAGWFAWIGDLFNGDAAAPDTTGVGFLHEGGMLTGWGWFFASVLVAALLIWLNQVVTGYIERTLIWDRCPLPVGWWLALTSIPRLLYVASASVVVWFTIDPLLPDDLWWKLGIGAVFVIFTAFAWLEARFAPAPVIVPPRTSDKVNSIVTDPAEQPMSLSAARASDAYKRALQDRQKQLDPQGWWARLWARSFHGWPELQRDAAAMVAAAAATAATAAAAASPAEEVAPAAPEPAVTA
ncbi:hypothetical protein [Agromyces sp. NPDC058110]|uniref:hypothetical protein n=1 Tax=Agromyces sp. NPDC058110 TaxID=3346345 RepID=UPI0036DF0370